MSLPRPWVIRLALEEARDAYRDTVRRYTQPPITRERPITLAEADQALRETYITGFAQLLRETRAPDIYAHLYGRGER